MQTKPRNADLNFEHWQRDSKEIARIQQEDKQGYSKKIARKQLGDNKDIARRWQGDINEIENDIFL